MNPSALSDRPTFLLKLRRLSTLVFNSPLTIKIPVSVAHFKSHLSLNSDWFVIIFLNDLQAAFLAFSPAHQGGIQLNIRQPNN